MNIKRTLCDAQTVEATKQHYLYVIQNKNRPRGSTVQRTATPQTSSCAFGCLHYDMNKRNGRFFVFKLLSVCMERQMLVILSL